MSIWMLPFLWKKIRLKGRLKTAVLSCIDAKHMPFWHSVWVRALATQQSSTRFFLLFFSFSLFFLENSSVYHLLRFITLAVQPQAYSSFVVCVYLARTRAPYCTGSGACTHCHQFDRIIPFLHFFPFYFSLLFF